MRFAALLLLLAGLTATACAGSDPVGRSRPRVIVPGAGSESFPAGEIFDRPARERAGWDEQRPWSPGIDWEPFVAADRSSRRVYQAAIRYGATDCPGCPDPVLVFRRSDDGGATWGPDRYPFRDGVWHADPQIAVAADGTLFVGFMLGYRPGVVVSRSSDGGDSWSDLVDVTGPTPPRWSDKPWLAISPGGDRIYMALNASDSWIAASHDGGRTFAPAARTNDDGRYWFHGGGAVGPDGTVVFAATDYSQSYRGGVGINAIVSRDGGSSWRTIRVDRSEEPPECGDVPGCYLGFLGPQANVAVDSDGTFLLVYNAGRRPGRPQRLWARTSTDGIEWSAPHRLGGGRARVTHGFAAVAAGTRAGEFHVTWQDDRREPGVRWNTWHLRTRDGGASWSSRRRLSRGGPAIPWVDRSGYAFPYGDYFGLAVDADGLAHVAWGAGESYEGLGGVWFTRSR